MDFAFDLQEREQVLTEGRYHDQQKRVRKDQGYGSTDGGLAIQEHALPRLIEALPEAIGRLRTLRGEAGGAWLTVSKMSPVKIAACGLMAVLNSIGRKEKFVSTLDMIGSALNNEAFAEGLLSSDKRLAKDVTEWSKARYSGVDRRTAYAKAAAARAGFQCEEWPKDYIIGIGGWLWSTINETFPDLFELTGNGENKQVTLAPGASELADRAVQECLHAHPVYLPMDTPPVPWTSWVGGGPATKTGWRPAVMRTRKKDVVARAKASIKDGTMQPALDALNAMQAVPWRINRRAYGALTACLQHGIDVPGLPGATLALPRLPEGAEWKDLSKEEQVVFIRDKHAKRTHNLSVAGDRVCLRIAMETAGLFVDKPCFYTPLNMDFRGRVYGICNFNFQRNDYIRAMFEFAEGEPLGADGVYWLMVHIANTWAGPISDTDKRKTDKVPFNERVSWVSENWERISCLPDQYLREKWWLRADSPFQFLAACFELNSALTCATGPSTYKCHLPVSFDGSCSGIQHLSLMTRGREEAAQVNIVPTIAPADIYATVASIAAKRIAADATATWSDDETWKGEVARMALSHGVDRKLVKRNTMTFAYSSKERGMGGQLQEDTMDALKTDVLTGKLAAHPFGDYARGRVNAPGKAARYLASVNYAAIRDVLHKPAGAMEFLQRIAKALAHEGKGVQWTSPVGLPWVNRYHPPKCIRVSMWLYDRTARQRKENSVTTAVGYEAEVAKEKCANAIAPNVVHACDASHLLLVAKAGAAEGISIGTVHDCFACLPSRAGRLRGIILEQLVEMYDKHDVLAEILESAKADLTPEHHHMLPELPEKGTLDLKEVLNAQYAFA